MSINICFKKTERDMEQTDWLESHSVATPVEDGFPFGHKHLLDKDLA